MWQWTGLLSLRVLFCKVNLYRVCLLVYWFSHCLKVVLIHITVRSPALSVLFSAEAFCTRKWATRWLTESMFWMITNSSMRWMQWTDLQFWIWNANMPFIFILTRFPSLWFRSVSCKSSKLRRSWQETWQWKLLSSYKWHRVLCWRVRWTCCLVSSWAV